mgnify:FL=1
MTLKIPFEVGQRVWFFLDNWIATGTILEIRFVIKDPKKFAHPWDMTYVIDGRDWRGQKSTTDVHNVWASKADLLKQLAEAMKEDKP